MNNVFDIVGAPNCSYVVKNPGSSSKTGAIKDTGSLLNGNALNLSSACSFASANWTIPYSYSATLDPASNVKANVTTNAGVGKLTVN
jgi:pectate lyase